MQFHIITIFPKMFDGYVATSMIKRGIARGLVDVRVHDLRAYSADKKHFKVDERPYGGGPGMVLKVEPIIKALESILKISKSQLSISKRKRIKIILFSAGGKQFNSKIAIALAEKYDHIIMVAGHYEGVDERVTKIIENSKLKIENLSMGPYVLTGGELPAMVLMDAVSRHIPEFLGKSESLEEARFGPGLPAYTRPEVFTYKKKASKVPSVLLTGNHAKIDAWRVSHVKGFTGSKKKN